MKANIYLVVFFVALAASLSGQQLVANLNQGNASSDPSGLMSDGRYALFVARVTDGTSQLYLLDGPDGKPMILNDAIGRPIGNAYGTVLINGSLYFYTHAEASTTYYRMTLADRVVTDLGTFPSPGANGGEPSFTQVAGGVIFFHVDPDYQRHVYVTDGTAASARLLLLLPQQYSPQRMIKFGAHAFIEFGYDPDTESVYGVSDGTEAGSKVMFPTDGSIGIFARSALGSELIVYSITGQKTTDYVLDGATATLTPLRERVPTLPAGNVTTYASGQGYTYFISSVLRTDDQLGRIDPATNLAESVVSLNPLGDSTFAVSLQVFDDLIFYRRYDPITRLNSLYRTDGTQAGTLRLLTDITASSFNGFSLGEVVPTASGIYYFLADRPASGTELWRTDGTRAGTYLLKDVYPGPGSAEIDQLVAFGNGVLFVGESAEFGRELFYSDGTAGGTSVLADLNERESSSFPNDFFTFNDTLYFSATTGCTGYELFKTGGTAASTSLLADFEPGRESSFTGAFTPLDGKLYFGVSAGGFSVDRVFRTDGSVTEDLGLAVRLGSTGVSLSGPGSVNGLLVIQGFFGGIGQSLYAYDPATDSLSLLKVFSRSGGNSFGGNPFTALNDSVLLFQEATPEFGVELWRTDGTAAGTYLVKDIRQVNEQSIYYHIGELTVIEDIAYFSADDGFGSRPFRSDGTEAGTYELQGGGFLNRPGDFTAYAGRVYFTAGFTNNYRIYSTVGGQQDVEESALTSGGGTSFGFIDDLTVIGERLVFTASTDATGYELWAAASPDSPAVLLGDLNAGPADSYPRDLTVWGDFMYFSADIPELGRELWSTDGTPEGTVLVADINPGAASSETEQLYVYRNYLYFRANDGLVGAELWRYAPDGQYDERGDPNVVTISCSIPTDTTSTSVGDWLDAAVTVFPNPASDRVTVTLSEHDEPVVADLYSSDGQRIYASGTPQLRHDLPLAHLPVGMYHIRLLEPTSGRVASKPLMVVH